MRQQNARSTNKLLESSIIMVNRDQDHYVLIFPAWKNLVESVRRGY